VRFATKAPDLPACHPTQKEYHPTCLVPIIRPVTKPISPQKKRRRPKPISLFTRFFRSEKGSGENLLYRFKKRERALPGRGYRVRVEARGFRQEESWRILRWQTIVARTFGHHKRFNIIRGGKRVFTLFEGFFITSGRVFGGFLVCVLNREKTKKGGGKINRPKTTRNTKEPPEKQRQSSKVLTKPANNKPSGTPGFGNKD